MIKKCLFPATKSVPKEMLPIFTKPIMQYGVEEESAPTNMAIIGRYILTPDIFDILRNIEPDENGEIQITDALLTQAKQGKVIAYKFKGKRFDCGGIKGYVEAINYFAKHQGIV